MLYQYARDSRCLELVASGERDITFAGTDKINELTIGGAYSDPKVIDEVTIDCRLVLAGVRSSSVLQRLDDGEQFDVATSYPNTLRQYAADNRLNLTPYEVSGGCEGEAAAGLCEVIFDITATGDSLWANGLEVVDQLPNIDLLVLEGISRYEAVDIESVLIRIAATYQNRLRNPILDSQTSTLLGSWSMLVDKFDEEAGELFDELTDPDSTDAEVLGEAADLKYVIDLCLALRGLSGIDVLYEDIRRNKEG